MAKATLTELYRAGLDVYPSSMRGLARAPDRIKPKAAAKFLEWVKRAHPKLFAAAEKQAGPVTLGQVTTTTAQPAGAFDRIMDAITKLAPVYIQARAQKELLDVQMDRARNNLPPLDPRDYAPAVNVSVDPASAAAAAAAAGSAAKPYLLIGGAALGLVLLMQLTKGRRRR